MAGTLFVVATPIGNLEDLTFRALRVLKEVDVIAAEDTRRTAKLLAHYEIRRPLTSVREQNEARAATRLIAKIKEGQSVALVSDAGTPGISDPGARFVALAREQGVTVVPIPGPSAVVSAISVSGFPMDEFVFMGFPPASGGVRSDWLRRAATESRAVVFFEAPHRVRRTLGELGLLAERPILVCRELSKIHEESVVRPITAISEVLKDRGEYVFILAPLPPTPAVTPDPSTVSMAVSALTTGAGMDDEEAHRFVGRALDLKDRQVAKIIKKHNISVKQQNKAGP